MKLILMRHGETDWNKAQRIQGSSDIRLNNNGKAQADKAANILAEQYPDIKRIYASPLLRTRETAEIIAGKLNAEYSFHDGLREITLGEWEGLTWNEVEEKYPEGFREWMNNRRYCKASKGESYNEVLIRFIAELQYIIEMHSENDTALVVTHGGVIMALKCLIHKTKFEEMLQYLLNNTCFIELQSNVLPKQTSLITAGQKL
jgi:broad specificity phosphatase PhoE